MKARFAKLDAYHEYGLAPKRYRTGAKHSCEIGAPEHEVHDMEMRFLERDKATVNCKIIPFGCDTLLQHTDPRQQCLTFLNEYFGDPPDDQTYQDYYDYFYTRYKTDWLDLFVEEATKFNKHKTARLSKMVARIAKERKSAIQFIERTKAANAAAAANAASTDIDVNMDESAYTDASVRAQLDTMDSKISAEVKKQVANILSDSAKPKGKTQKGNKNASQKSGKDSKKKKQNRSNGQASSKPKLSPPTGQRKGKATTPKRSGGRNKQLTKQH